MPNNGLTDQKKQQDAVQDKEVSPAPGGPKERPLDKKVGRIYEEAAKQQPQSLGQPAGGE